MKTIVTWQLTLKTASESNSSENRWAKSKRHRIQKRRIKEAFLIDRPQMIFPLKIILTRIAPRQLDIHDNLPMSFKWIVDAIADNIFPGKAAGRADDSKEITWEYKQEKGRVRQYGVKIEIQNDS